MIVSSLGLETVSFARWCTMIFAQLLVCVCVANILQSSSKSKAAVSAAIMATAGNQCQPPHMRPEAAV